MKLAPARIGRQAVIAAVAGALLLAAPIAVTADTGPEPAAPKPGTSAKARTASPGTGPVAAGENCSPGHHCLFYTHVNSAKKEYFDSARYFWDDTFSNGEPVNDNSWAASNSSNRNRESHWYDEPHYYGAHMCVNPGDTVHSLAEFGWADRISSLRVMPRTSDPCFRN